MKQNGENDNNVLSVFKRIKIVKYKSLKHNGRENRIFARHNIHDQQRYQYVYTFNAILK
jgi:hypothetical protein